MKSKQQHTKYIFVTGGVTSSLGKGILASSLGALLETRGLRVALVKADPYLNVDPGTMSPMQHGEVFVTEDGAETDLDLGHYERFTQAKLTKLNSFSSGQVYEAVLNKEREGVYLGKTVQVVPHVTGQIKERMFLAAEGADIAIIEIGGTVGDIEGLPYLETIRQICYEFGRGNVVCIHLTLIPYLSSARELKTKPTQHSVKELRSIGIQPDILVCRTERTLPVALKEKIALFCNVQKELVIEAKDTESIYMIPQQMHDQSLDQKVLDLLNIWTRKPDLTHWRKITESLKKPKGQCTIAVVGKYTEVVDAYKSINEALVHAGIGSHLKVNIRYVDAVKVPPNEISNELEDVAGIIVPGGFGVRGIESKLAAITYARESQVPFLGICLGMQLAVVEFARSVLGLPKAASEELTEGGEDPIIHIMEGQRGVGAGGTMRLGGYPCRLAEGSKAWAAYGKITEVTERHRHRYEFNNNYRTLCERNGVVFAGVSPDRTLVELIELDSHPWFVACQFHPELTSKPTQPHPLFQAFVTEAYSRKNDNITKAQVGQKGAT